MIKYLGGKFRYSKQIAEILESLRKPGQTYLEPFVGGAWVVSKMSGVRIASDVNEAVINYYRHIQSGWVPPKELSREAYERIKAENDINDPMHVFALISCSFGSQYKVGFAICPTGRNFALVAHNGIMKRRHLIDDVIFNHCSYLDYKPVNCLIYCDPPYHNTKAYRGTGNFDHELFWDTMREWRKNNIVVISEYKAPNDFNCIKEFDHRLSIRSKNGCEKRIERLFI